MLFNYVYWAQCFICIHSPLIPIKAFQKNTARCFKTTILRICTVRADDKLRRLTDYRLEKTHFLNDLWKQMARLQHYWDPNGLQFNRRKKKITPKICTLADQTLCFRINTVVAIVTVDSVSTWIVCTHTPRCARTFSLSYCLRGSSNHNFFFYFFLKKYQMEWRKGEH